MVTFDNTKSGVGGSRGRGNAAAAEDAPEKARLLWELLHCGRARGGARVAAAEADGAARNEEQDERDKGQPEARTAVRGDDEVVKVVKEGAHTDEKGNVDRERDERERRGEECEDRREQHERDVRRERSEECNERHGRRDRVHGKPARPGRANEFMSVRVEDVNRVAMAGDDARALFVDIRAIRPNSKAELVDVALNAGHVDSAGCKARPDNVERWEARKGDGDEEAKDESTEEEHDAGYARHARGEDAHCEE